MKLNKLVVALIVMAPLAFASAAYAVTVPSDYAQDVQDGNRQVTADKTAKAQQNEVKDGENTEGQVDDGQVDVNETVGEQEGSMDDSQHGESSDKKDTTDQKDSKTDNQKSDKKTDSTGARN